MIQPHSIRWLAISLMLVTQSALSQTSPQIPNIITFGESTVDSPGLNETEGNNYWVKAQDGNTGTAITNPDQQGNRYTWVNYLAMQLNLLAGDEVTPWRVAANNPTMNPNTNNVNYAFASSLAVGEYSDDDYQPNQSCKMPGLTGDNKSACIPSFKQQIALYLADLTEPTSQDSLYVVSIGGNDIFTGLTHQLDPKEYIPVVVENIATGIEALITQGHANNIIIFKLPDLKDLPATQLIARNVAEQKMRLLRPFIRQYILYETTKVSRDFNQQLQVAIEDINATYQSNVQLFPADTLLNTIRTGSYPQITNANDMCITEDQAETTTPSCQGYLFYDGKHLTEAGHQILANQLFEFISEIQTSPAA